MLPLFWVWEGPTLKWDSRSCPCLQDAAAMTLAPLSCSGVWGCEMGLCTQNRAFAERVNEGFSSIGSQHRAKSRAVVNLTETTTIVQAWCLLSRWLPGHQEGLDLFRLSVVFALFCPVRASVCPDWPSIH